MFASTAAAMRAATTLRRDARRERVVRDPVGAAHPDPLAVHVDRERLAGGIRLAHDRHVPEADGPLHAVQHGAVRGQQDDLAGVRDRVAVGARPPALRARHVRGQRAPLRRGGPDRPHPRPSRPRAPAPGARPGSPPRHPRDPPGHHRQPRHAARRRRRQADLRQPGPAPRLQRGPAPRCRPSPASAPSPSRTRRPSCATTLMGSV